MWSCNTYLCKRADFKSKFPLVLLQFISACKCGVARKEDLQQKKKNSKSASDLVFVFKDMATQKAVVSGQEYFTGDGTTPKTTKKEMDSVRNVNKSG